jgi:hypothetical protein
LHEAVSDSFSHEINQFPTNTAIVVYFWSYAKQFKLTQLPVETVDMSHVPLHEILSRLKEYDPAMLNRWRQHLLDNDRKSQER